MKTIIIHFFLISLISTKLSAEGESFASFNPVCTQYLNYLRGVNSANNSTLKNLPTGPALNLGYLDRKSSNKNDRPPLRVDKLLAQFAAGEFVGFSAGALGLVLLNHPEEKSSEGYPVVTWLGSVGFFASYCIGSAGGVYYVGNTRNETGSFNATFIGSATGILLSIGSYFVLDEPIITGSLFLFGPTIGAIIGFSMTRECIKLSKGDALFKIGNFQHCKFSVPKFNLQFENTFGSTSLKISSTIVKLQF